MRPRQFSNRFSGTTKTIAKTWWLLFRKEQSDEKPDVAMKRVGDVMAGKLERKKLDEWLAKMDKRALVKEDPANDPRRMLSRANCLEAQGVACRAAGDDQKAEEYLAKAAEMGNSVARWIKLGDFLMTKKQYKKAGKAYGKGAKGFDAAGAEPEIDDDGSPSEESTTAPRYLHAGSCRQSRRQSG